MVETDLVCKEMVNEYQWTRIPKGQKQVLKLKLLLPFSKKKGTETEIKTRKDEIVKIWKGMKSQAGKEYC